MTGPDTITRRELLLGKPGSDGARYHVSGAIIRVIPRAMADLVTRLKTMAGVEIVAGTADRLVVTIEGESAGALGARLTEINLLDGVIAASMVYEHSEAVEELHDEHGSQPT